MSATEPLQIERLCVASLKPGDVIVVESDMMLSSDQKDYICSGLAKIWPNNKVVVCDRGFRLKVVEPSEVPA